MQPTTPQPEQAPVQPGAELPTAPAEQAPGVPAQAPATPPPAPVAVVPAASVQPTTPAPVSTPPATNTTAPATADDVDVIEKEWVDAAQKVVEKNANDPHAEEEGFEDLQVDYLKKRYGKDIKKPSE